MFYRRIRDGGNAYLDRQTLDGFHQRFPMSHKGRAVFANHLNSVKAAVQEFAAVSLACEDIRRPLANVLISSLFFATRPMWTPTTSSRLTGLSARASKTATIRGRHRTPECTTKTNSWENRLMIWGPKAATSMMTTSILVNRVDHEDWGPRKGVSDRNGVRSHQVPIGTEQRVQRFWTEVLHGSWHIS